MLFIWTFNKTQEISSFNKTSLFSINASSGCYCFQVQGYDIRELLQASSWSYSSKMCYPAFLRNCKKSIMHKEAAWLAH